MTARSAAPDQRFRRAHRLSKDREFQAVFGARMRKSDGPMTLYTKPNELPHSRLGLSVGRRVGNAVKRNLLKRLIREAFRLNRHAFPAPYDVVVVLRPHETRTLDEYESMLLGCLEKAHESWLKRGERGSDDTAN